MALRPPGSASHDAGLLEGAGPLLSGAGMGRAAYGSDALGLDGDLKFQRCCLATVRSAAMKAGADTDVGQPAPVRCPAMTTVDLFAGAGGLALGFHALGIYTPVLGVEIDHAAASTFKTNFGCEVHDGPIQTRLRWPEADVIVGGPPCQGFSPLGRDRDDVSRAALNGLWEHYVRAVRAIQTRSFVI